MEKNTCERNIIVHVHLVIEYRAVEEIEYTALILFHTCDVSIREREMCTTILGSRGGGTEKKG